MRTLSHLCYDNIAIVDYLHEKTSPPPNHVYWRACIHCDDGRGKASARYESNFIQTGIPFESIPNRCCSWRVVRLREARGSDVSRKIGIGISFGQKIRIISQISELFKYIELSFLRRAVVGERIEILA